jgi:hypothetical protein
MEGIRSAVKEFKNLVRKFTLIKVIPYFYATFS